MCAERDVDAGWDASVNSAKCIILLAEAEARLGTQELRTRGAGRFGAQLPLARKYLQRCQSKMPCEGEIPELLRRCDAMKGRTVESP